MCRAVLAERFPDHDVLAEELSAGPGRSGARAATAGCSTRSTARPTTRTACRSSARRWRSRSTAEPTSAPSTTRRARELFTAERGQGAFLNGTPLQGVRRPARWSTRCSSPAFPTTCTSSGPELVELFGAFLGRARAVRRLGSAALDLCYVAAGRFDGFWEQHLKPWDVAAGALIVDRGRRTHHRDGRRRRSTRVPAISSPRTGLVHDAMLDVIRDSRTGRTLARGRTDPQELQRRRLPPAAPLTPERLDRPHVTAPLRPVAAPGIPPADASRCLRAMACALGRIDSWVRTSAGRRSCSVPGARAGDGVAGAGAAANRQLHDRRLRAAGEDARVAGDVLDENRTFLVFDLDEFNSFTAGAEWLFPIGRFVEGGAGVSFTGRSTVPTVYRCCVDNDRQRDRAGAAAAPHPDRPDAARAAARRVVAGAGLLSAAGVSLISWRYTETGDFIDFNNNGEVFRDRVRRLAAPRPAAWRSAACASRAARRPAASR